jgi:FAD/FMN-containing dehydrogenase
MLNRMERALPGQISAFELMWDDFVTAAGKAGAQSPLSGVHPFHVLVEVEASEDTPFLDTLAALLEDGIVSDAIVAQSDRDSLGLWKLRDAIGSIVGAMGIVEPFDVSAPIAVIGKLVQDLRPALLAALPGCAPCFFGHVADGNLHLALELTAEQDRRVAEAIVYDAVRAASGSISAEHGIGLLKRGWLGHSRSAEEIALMRALRRMMDPRGILNPGRVC